MREKGLLEGQQNRHCIQLRATLTPSSAWIALGVIMEAAGGLPSQDTDAHQHRALKGYKTILFA